MTRLILFFKNIHAQNIYKLSSVSIHLIFSSDIHDVETSFFTQKNKYRYLANSGNTVFSGEAKKYNHKSQLVSWEYTTQFSQFIKGKKWYKLVKLVHFLGLRKNPSNVLEELS